MQVLREKQKTIIWAVAIIIIPSFVILFGGGMSALTMQSAAPVAQVFDKTVTNVEFHEFRQRMAAVLNGRQIKYWQFPPLAEDQGAFSLLMAMTHIQAARDAGLRVPDNQIGTFIENQPAVCDANGNFDEKKYEKMLKAFELTNDEYIQGVEEWMLLQQFLTQMDSSPLVSDEMAYLHYVQGHSEITYKSVEIRAKAFEEKAEKEFLEAKKDEERTAAMQDYLARHQDDRQFWTLPKWRFEYIFAPKDVEGLAPAVTDKEVQAHYDLHKETYAEKSFADVKDVIRAELLDTKKLDMAELTIRQEVDPLFTQALEGNSLFDVKMLETSKALKIRGVLRGDSGTTLLLTQDFRSLPMVGDSSDLQLFLDGIAEIKDEPARNAAIEKLTKNFDTRSTPLRSKAGVFRIRLLGYEKAVPRTLESDKGLRAQLALAIIQERAREMAYEHAESVSDKIEAGKLEGFPLEEKSASFANVPEELALATLGTCVLRRTQLGAEVLVPIRKTMLSLEEFSNFPASMRKQIASEVSQRLQGRIMPYGGMIAISVGPRLGRWNQEQYANDAFYFLDMKRD